MNIKHCDHCNEIMPVGDAGLRLCISEFITPKPGRPRMQYIPGNSSNEPMGLFEVDIELCHQCVRKPLDFYELFAKMTAGIDRTKFGP